jgi:hypothetical protein
LPRLGKNREGVGCVHAKRLTEVDTAVLAQVTVLALKDHKSRQVVSAELP